MEEANNNITTSEPNVNTQTTTSEPYKTFSTQDDYEKAMKSTSSKAKNDILKELGINSVSEFKDLKANFENSVKEKDELNKTIDSLNKKITLRDLGVNPSNIDDFMSLTIKRVSDEKDFETASKEVAELYPNMLMNSKDSKKDVKVGVEKSEGTKSEPQYSDELTKRFPYLKNRKKI